MGRNTENAFFLIGISHKTAPVEIRERVSFDFESIGPLLAGIRGQEGVAECVALSTCNRTELYALLREPCDDARGGIEGFLLALSGAGEDLRPYFYTRSGIPVIEHLFRVVSGLDSMIVGEPQIFGQVKAAYSLACDQRTTGPAINRLFHHAFRVGKIIRSTTSVGEGAVSVSYAAVELARKIFGNLEGRSVLLVGAGKTGELCARGLVDSGVESLFIANRTPARASDLAERLTGEVIPFERIHDMTGTADIIITSVASRDPVFLREQTAERLALRAGKPLFLIDLGVPRNIEPGVSHLEGVHVYDIDDLQDVILDNQDRRRSEAERAEELIQREVGEFCCWLSEREVAPVIRDLHDRCETIRQDELERIRNRVSPETLEIMDLVTRRIVRKILHNPTVAMRSSETGGSRERILDTVRELFMNGGSE
jgi:glutamyl-tRNA reductase